MVFAVQSCGQPATMTVKIYWCQLHLLITVGSIGVTTPFKIEVWWQLLLVVAGSKIQCRVRNLNFGSVWMDIANKYGYSRVLTRSLYFQAVHSTIGRYETPSPHTAIEMLNGKPRYSNCYGQGLRVIQMVLQLTSLMRTLGYGIQKWAWSEVQLDQFVVAACIRLQLQTTILMS